MTAINGSGAQIQIEMRRTYQKVDLHLLPFLFICYLFNYFDRVNVSFGKLKMLDDLHLSETVYGLAARPSQMAGRERACPVEERPDRGRKEPSVQKLLEIVPGEKCTY